MKILASTDYLEIMAELEKMTTEQRMSKAFERYVSAETTLFCLISSLAIETVIDLVIFVCLFPFFPTFRNASAMPWASSDS